MILVDEQIDNEDTPIAPLMLIALVENAFKHSLLHEGKRSIVKLMLKVEQNKLTFEVFNHKSTAKAKRNPDRKGIGVENVKKQLALQYPNRHSMAIDSQPNTYKVTLNIDLITE